MSEDFYPYVIFLPIRRKQKVLRAIFGSNVPMDILMFSIDQGICQKIYQKNLIESLKYSNKTVIEHLKELTSSGILDEDMEKAESDGRTVWVKYYMLSDLGKWLALLLKSEKAMSRDEKVDLIRSIFKAYVRWVKKLSEQLGIEKEVLEKIFKKEME
jgi:predicted ArsR family transcriptional regulator